jgi:hypothetical protein
MIEPPVAAPVKKNKRTIALVVVSVLLTASLCAAGVVAVTIRSGLFDRVVDGYEDSQALAQLREGACLAELPQLEPGKDYARPPKVVDCDAAEAQWIIDDESPGVPLEVYERYRTSNKAIYTADVCDTNPQQLETVYAVGDRSADTVTVYCIVPIPLGR